VTGVAATLAGCSDALSSGTPTPTETPFTWRVRRRPVYFGPEVGRRPPDYMQVVDGAVVEPLAAEEGEQPGLGTGFVDNDDWIAVVDSMLRGLEE